MDEMENHVAGNKKAAARIEARRLEMRRILQKAEALGMTYGKYVAYLESKRGGTPFDGCENLSPPGYFVR